MDQLLDQLVQLAIDCPALAPAVHDYLSDEDPSFGAFLMVDLVPSLRESVLAGDEASLVRLMRFVEAWAQSDRRGFDGLVHEHLFESLEGVLQPPQLALVAERMGPLTRAAFRDFLDFRDGSLMPGRTPRVRAP